MGASEMSHSTDSGLAAYLHPMPLHIIKLVVGMETLDELVGWRREREAREPDWRVHTRSTPKRAAEVEDGGSIYRVIKGVIVARQRILRIETHGEGRAARCQMVVSPAACPGDPDPPPAVPGLALS